MEGDAESSASEDGTTDFRAYSLVQLQELQRFIDRRAYPRNFVNLAAEIERRLAEQPGDAAQPLDSRATAGRFSKRDGWLGWLQALWRRSPVFGAGEIEVMDDAVRLAGNHRTWLGSSAPREYLTPTDRVRNCVIYGATLRFEIKRRWYPARTVEFEAGSEAQAQALMARLPTNSSAPYSRRWQESREFNTRLNELGVRGWLAPFLVLANIAVFVAMLIARKTLAPALDPTLLLDWGANFGPLTVGGQWWRLVSSMFLHADWLHLLLNMWVLWNVGRQAERLYGTPLFAFIYFASGICGSLARTVWEPGVSSVGASGAIFGVVGALLAMLLNPAARIPKSIAFAYWPSTLLFVLVNLVSGMQSPFVDNAAHIGGLLGGLAFGWLCVRPIEREQRSALPTRSIVASGLLALVIGGASFSFLYDTHGKTSVTERFMLARPWYVRGETANLQLWQELAWRASNGTVSEQELAERLDKEIIPFWKESRNRLEAEIPAVVPAEKPLHELVREFVRLRFEWATALRDLARDSDSENGKRVTNLQQQTSKINARIQRVMLRANFDQRPRALANSGPVLKVKSWFSAGARECVMPPPDQRPGARDAPGDGPKLRQKIACQAQKQFVAGNYAALEDSITAASRHLADLPDGASTLSAIFDGLDDYCEYGGIAVETLLGKTSDWRRAVRPAIGAELAEILVFRNWAWSARGHGTANSVSREAWEIFALRNEMAAAGLEELRPLAVTNPYWYQTALNSGLDMQTTEQEMDRLFEEGANRFPDYLPIYTSRLRSLMPRWGGSMKQIETLVFNAAAQHPGSLEPDERYATLYAIYSYLEDDEINLFAAGDANWQRVQDGFAGLRTRYPRSDLVLNQFAKFACMAGDAQRYGSLRPYIDGRRASRAWSEAKSIEGCDSMFGQNAGVPRVSRDPAPDGQSRISDAP
jgi:membrane associated rhomboid family serine protease